MQRYSILLLAGALCVALSAVPVPATTIRVPADQRTIQAGIDAAVNAGPVSNTCEVVDDFADGVLDPALWSTPYGRVREADGVCYIHQRGFLNLTRSFDPALYDIRVELDVSFGDAGDFIDIVTRSDGVSNPSFYGEVMNGLKFGIKASDACCPNNGVAIDYFVNGTPTRAPNDSVYVDLQNMLPVYHFAAVDSGGVYTILVDGVIICDASGPLPQMGSGLTFYNREYNYELSIDNLRIAATPKSSCECHCQSDAECDGASDILDVVSTINRAFRGSGAIFDCSCPRHGIDVDGRTDVDCSGGTDVIDVVKMIDVAFRGADAATEFCEPCQQD